MFRHVLATSRRGLIAQKRTDQNLCRSHFSARSNYSWPPTARKTISCTAMINPQLKFIDIGANLLDIMYNGGYNGKSYHPADLSTVLDRAFSTGITKLIITAGTLEESQAALALARTDPRLYSTVGVHPTRCGEFESHAEGPDDYLAQLLTVIEDGKKDGKVVAVGECGLDYDRLHFCDAETQKKWFTAQFQLARAAQLPMFLHLRAASATDDFMEIINEHNDDFTAGVAHSFDGTLEDLEKVLANPKLSIGINGCSLKTDDNLKVVAQIPIDRLLLETDCPWCDIRPSHAGHQFITDKGPLKEVKDKKKHDPCYGVKGRNEPSSIVQVLQVVAGVRGVDGGEGLERLASQVYDTTERIFFNNGTK